jgi:hypothetical protein
MKVEKRANAAEISDNDGNFVALIERDPNDPNSFWVDTLLEPPPYVYVDETAFFRLTALDMDAAIAHTLFLIESELSKT